MIIHWFRRRRRYLRFTRHVAVAIRRRLIRVTALFAALFSAHVAAMVLAEGLAFDDAVWLTITTATTVGYGDLSAETPLGRLATILCMYLFGIFLLAQAASDLFDYRALRRERRRRGEFKWRNMTDHLLIVNVPAQEADSYLGRFVEHVRRAPALADIPVQLLTPRYADGLPQELVEAGVTHYNGVAENTEHLLAANAPSARCAFIIAEDPYDPRCDAQTFDVLCRLAALPGGAPGVVVAEVVDDANRERTQAAGATSTVRPVRAYPEMVVRALVSPGVEQVLENLFTRDADHLMRFDIPFAGLRWADVVVGFVRGGAGVPMGYVREDGQVNTNPHPDDVCVGTGVITLIDEGLTVTHEAVATCLRDAGGLTGR